MGMFILNSILEAPKGRSSTRKRVIALYTINYDTHNDIVIYNLAGSAPPHMVRHKLACALLVRELSFGSNPQSRHQGVVPDPRA